MKEMIPNNLLCGSNPIELDDMLSLMKATTHPQLTLIISVALA
jgi:hypothetical protein